MRSCVGEGTWPCVCRYPQEAPSQNWHSEFYAFFWRGAATGVAFSKGLMPPPLAKQTKLLVQKAQLQGPRGSKGWGAFLKCI